MLKVRVREEIGRFKYVENINIKNAYEKILENINTEILSLEKGEPAVDEL